ncbi:hypothetical protein SH449x_003422 [Pirellulaceae bacterium SH449]
MQLRYFLLMVFLFGLFQSVAVVQAQQPELSSVLKKLDELEQTLNSLVCSGHYSFGKRVDFEFCVRSELAKQVEEEKDGTVVSLWNKSGYFVIRRPKGDDWSLAAMEKPGSKQTRTIAPILFESLSIVENKLTELLRSDDYTVLSLKHDQGNPKLIELRLKYNPGMDSYDWNAKNSATKPPVFDEATILLDSSSGYRITEYRLDLSVGGRKGKKRVRLEYESEGDGSIPIPKSVLLEYLDVNGHRLNSEKAIWSNLVADAPPKEEFELEFYGIKTPVFESEDRINWSWVYFYAVCALCFVYVGVRFFKRARQ